MKTVEKFIPCFKLGRFTGIEGKEKVIKKLKECLEKNNIAYQDKNISDLIIPLSKIYIIS